MIIKTNKENKSIYEKIGLDQLGIFCRMKRSRFADTLVLEENLVAPLGEKNL